MFWFVAFCAGERRQVLFKVFKEVFQTYLMFHVVLHVHVPTSKNFKTEGTEQFFSVFVDCPEMCLHIRKERRSVIADLWDWRERESSVTEA